MNEVESLRRRLAEAYERIAALKAQVKDLTTCDWCGEPLSRGLCKMCDNDE